MFMYTIGCDISPHRAEAYGYELGYGVFPYRGGLSGMCKGAEMLLITPQMWKAVGELHSFAVISFQDPRHVHMDADLQPINRRLSLRA